MVLSQRRQLRLVLQKCRPPRLGLHFCSLCSHRRRRPTRLLHRCCVLPHRRQRTSVLLPQRRHHRLVRRRLLSQRACCLPLLGLGLGRLHRLRFTLDRC